VCVYTAESVVSDAGSLTSHCDSDSKCPPVKEEQPDKAGDTEEA